MENSFRVRVDLAAHDGPVRPLHGVNEGPMTKVFTYDARPEFKEIGIPLCRLHDTEYPFGSGEFVDIPCIFKDFDADENDPESYNFGLTDLYIEKILEVGAEPIFRLGVSIEHAPVKRHVFPPKDFAKWARICEHIIRHYNEGWAGGHEWNLRWWEIWNEADGGSNMWNGTPEQFYELYRVAACHLKSCFPDLLIGGCGWTRACNAFTEGFLKYISEREEQVPLDFYSWHRYYDDLSKFLGEWKKSKVLLERYGYPDALNVFDEWNYMRDWNDQPDSYVTLKNYKGAAFCAATLAALQSLTDIAAATYFEGDVVKEWCGLFDVAEMSIGAHGRKATVKKLKPFYAFRYFGDLYRMGEAVKTEAEGEGIYACAARSSEGKAGILAANYTPEGRDTRVAFEVSSAKGLPEVRITDRTRTDRKIIIPDIERRDGKVCFTVRMPAHSFVLVTFPAGE